MCLIVLNTMLTSSVASWAAARQKKVIDRVMVLSQRMARVSYISVNDKSDIEIIPTCSPRDPRFAGSNPVEVGGFFQDVKILNTSPPGGTLSWGSQV